MKALTLWQTWASLVALGAKKIETRSWRTTYRGELAIHSSQKMTREMKALCEREPFASALDHVFAAGDELPLGAIVAVCNLKICLPLAGIQRNVGPVEGVGYFRLPPDEPERSFGDYAPGRFAWILTNIRRLDSPIPCKGELGLWAVPAFLCEQIKTQL